MAQNPSLYRGRTRTYLRAEGKKKAERQLTAEDAAMQRFAADQLIQLGADPLEVVQASIVATFGRIVREASLTAGATMDHALEAEERAASEAEASLSAACAMRE